MILTDSPLSSVHLRQQPTRFETLVGLRVDEFDALFTKVYEAELGSPKTRHGLWTPDRVERLVQTYRPVLQEYLCVTLLYLRQYPSQAVLAASFGLSQGQVSKIIQRMSRLLEQVLPTPAGTAAAVVAFVERLPPELLDAYAAPVILDATEQRIERSREPRQQRVDYSGKKSATAASFSSS